MKNLILVLLSVYVGFAAELRADVSVNQAAGRQSAASEDANATVYKSFIVREIQAIASDASRIVSDIRDEGTLGFFFKIGSSYSTLLGEHAFSQQSGFGIILHQRYSIALVNQRLRTAIATPSDTDKSIAYNSGGLELGYRFFNDALVQMQPQITFGFAKVTETKVGTGDRRFGHGNKRSGGDSKHGNVGKRFASEKRPQHASGLSLIEPMWNFDLSVTDWCKLSVGAGYRFILGDLNGVRDVKKSDFNTYVISSGLKVGLF